VSALRRLRSERGYSLIEMLTVMAILSVVLTGLTALFVQGSNAEMDMNRRFQAQQESRVALDKVRREIHCAQAGMTGGGNGPSSSIRLQLPAQCPTAVGGVVTDVTWCSVAVGTNRWALYRKVGTSCDSSGVKWADYLTQSALFDYRTQSSESLSKLRVQLSVDVKVGDATPVYSLCDAIVLRNSHRVMPDSTVLGYSDTAAPTPC
jgi:prepilin-type N-terminal cleavage/methylation domain-containing protein